MQLLRELFYFIRARLSYLLKTELNAEVYDPSVAGHSATEAE